MKAAPFTLNNLVAQIEDVLTTQGFNADIVFRGGISATLVIVSPTDRTKVAHCMVAMSNLPPVVEESE